MNKRIVVKIGSNALTRPDGRLDVTRMSSLVDQIAWMFDDGMDTSETAPHALDREAGVDVKEGRVRLADGPAGTYARRVRYRDRYQAKTDGARAWEGFSSGLRPCWEPVLVARAP